jgi:hypothetical protein
MNAFNARLPWVAQNDPEHGFQSRKVRAADTPLGIYEIFQEGIDFDAWFTSDDSGVLVFLGRTSTANSAREKCERHAKQWRKR